VLAQTNNAGDYIFLQQTCDQRGEGSKKSKLPLEGVYGSKHETRAREGVSQSTFRTALMARDGRKRNVSLKRGGMGGLE